MRRWRRILRSRRIRRGLVAALLLGGGLVLYGGVWEPRQLVEREYPLHLPRWSSACDGLRIDHVTDTHTGSPHNGLENLDRIVERLIASDAAAVAMTGDYLILSVFLGEYIPPELIAERLRPLTRRKPVFAVLGNHDWWKDGHKVRRALESAGVTVLEDEAQLVQLHQCRLWVVGVGDLWEAPHDVAKAFSGVAGNEPAIVLTHNPAILPRIPWRASLVLAGHTHGGQISFPFLGAPALWGKGAEGRFIRGHYVEDGRHLFVSPGIGTSILPMRIGVPPEISQLMLRQAPADRDR